MRKLKTLGSALVVALVLVTCADYVGYAATGSSFILGHSNSANKITGLARTTTGPALNLHTSTTSSAPFTTNAHGKVANLNADRLDGLDGAALQTRTWAYTLPAEAGVGQFSVSLPGLPPGMYLANYNLTVDTTDSVNCYFQYADSSITALTYGKGTGTYSALSGGGLIDTRAQTAKLVCFAWSSSMTLDSQPPAQVTFTKVDAVTSGASTSARVSAQRPAAGAVR
ncbi:MAG TPA: hypothetical protein VFM09_01620 [Marmoricola sp.]|nr:hypothetical protein [Marmoricola sp.]